MDKNGHGLIKKSARYMSNAPEVLKMLSKRRTGGHRHITPLNGRARQVQAYPPDLCKALCTGIKNQIKEEQSVTTNSLVNGKHWDDVSGG